MGKRISNRTLRVSQNKSNKKDKRANQIPSVGDIVVIHKENTSKMNFTLGIIDSFKPSRDGAKRIANLRYVIYGKTVHVRRPINNFIQQNATIMKLRLENSYHHFIWSIFCL